jgi:uncharacterized phage-associated protein
MSDAKNLAHWVLQNAPYSRPVTHLKLQKLLFYCYGAACAHDLEGPIGQITFLAWEHGPVNREVYDEFRSYGAGPLPPAPWPVFYPSPVFGVLTDAVRVYGALDAWSLREQSHRESPWSETQHGAAIPHLSLKNYFVAKFARGQVKCPEYLADVGGLHLDRIPVRNFATLHDLANAVSAQP